MSTEKLETSASTQSSPWLNRPPSGDDDDASKRPMQPRGSLCTPQTPPPTSSTAPTSPTTPTSTPTSPTGVSCASLPRGFGGSQTGRVSTRNDMRRSHADFESFEGFVQLLTEGRAMSLAITDARVGCGANSSGHFEHRTRLRRQTSLASQPLAQAVLVGGRRQQGAKQGESSIGGGGGGGGQVATAWPSGSQTQFKPFQRRSRFEIGEQH